MIHNFEVHPTKGLGIRNIDIAATLSCNLQCLGCSVGSNLAVKDGYTLQDRLSWVNNLADMLDRFNMYVDEVVIYGGEPFINSDFLDIFDLAKQRMSKSDIVIYTNGLLIERNESYLERLRDSNVTVRVSSHTQDEKIQKQIIKGVLLLKKHKIKHEITGVSFPVYKPEGERYHWSIPHPMDANGKIHPVNEANYKRSWAACGMKYCTPLYANALWKCTKLAYLKQTLAKTKQLDDPAWQPYLDYKPFALDDPNYDDLIDFFSTGPETVCSMCPNKVVYYDSKPVYKADYEGFDHSKGTSVGDV